jgi:ABC-type Fe3+-hydroxamate transport system substrate-binding protein
MPPALVDAIGRPHRPVGAGARVVSLVPSLTELMFDLGLADRLVGRTRYCVHPGGAVEALPSVGGTKKIRLDRLRELAPTHVLVNVDENPKELADAIATAGVEVVVTHPETAEDNPALYRLLGGLFGAEAAAEALCRRFQAAYGDLLAARPGLPARRVLYLIWRDPWMTVAPQTYVARTLALVNWEAIGGTGAIRYPEIRLDASLLDDVDLVLFSSEPFAFTDFHVAEFAAAFPAHAAKARRIDGEMVSWYGSRAVAGLAYLKDFALRLAAP